MLESTRSSCSTRVPTTSTPGNFLYSSHPPTPAAGTQPRPATSADVDGPTLSGCIVSGAAAVTGRYRPAVRARPPAVRRRARDRRLHVLGRAACPMRQPHTCSGQVTTLAALIALVACFRWSAGLQHASRPSGSWPYAGEASRRWNRRDHRRRPTPYPARQVPIVHAVLLIDSFPEDRIVSSRRILSSDRRTAPVRSHGAVLATWTSVRRLPLQASRLRNRILDTGQLSLDHWMRGARPWIAMAPARRTLQGRRTSPISHPHAGGPRR